MDSYCDVDAGSWLLAERDENPKARDTRVHLRQGRSAQNLIGCPPQPLGQSPPNQASQSRLLTLDFELHHIKLRQTPQLQIGTAPPPTPSKWQTESLCMLASFIMPSTAAIGVQVVGHSVHDVAKAEKSANLCAASISMSSTTRLPCRTRSRKSRRSAPARRH